MAKIRNIKKSKAFVAVLAFLPLLFAYTNCSQVEIESLDGAQLGQGGDFDIVDGDSLPVLPGDEGTLPPTITPPTLPTIPSINHIDRFSLNPMAAKKELDIILIIDDSGSMDRDSKNLAAKLSGFVGKLESAQIGWQMCLVTTSYAKQGFVPRSWVENTNSGNRHLLKSGTPQLDGVFVKTIEAINFGGDATGDERGTASLVEVVKGRKTTGCLRDETNWAAVIISDEDVRSVGGDASYNSGQFRELQQIDQPSYLKALIDQQLSLNSSFSFYSIVVKDGDLTCKKTQDDQCGYRSGQPVCPAYYGRHYQQLSELTKSPVGSICASDYGQILNDFSDDVMVKTSELKLKCQPISGVEIKVSPEVPLKWKLSGDTILIDQAITEYLNLEVTYSCSPTPSPTN